MRSGKESRLRSAEPPLSARIAGLSSKRRETIRPAIERPRDYVLLSVRDMAVQLSTDPATIVRIVRGLGFATYREFQRYLHELSLAFATSRDTMPAPGADVGDDGEYAQNYIRQDLKNLQNLQHRLDSAQLNALARRCHEARRIVILGCDLAEYLVGYLRYHLMLLGLPAVEGTSAGRIYHLTRSVTKQDVVVAITFRRGLRETIEGVKQARRKGAYCIGIADTYLSPLGRECDELLLASIESPSFGASYTAPISLLGAVFVACGQYKKSNTLEIVEEIAEEQRRGTRWYRTE